MLRRNGPVIKSVVSIVSNVGECQRVGRPAYISSICMFFFVFFCLSVLPEMVINMMNISLPYSVVSVCQTKPLSVPMLRTSSAITSIRLALNKLLKISLSSEILAYLWSPYVIGRPYIFSFCFFFFLSFFLLA